jgi:hypothetical protein
MFKKIILLAISCGLAIVAAFVQQAFISDNPVKTSIEINNTNYSFKLPVVNESDQECLIELAIPDTSIKGMIYYKVAKANDELKSLTFIRMNDNLVNILPYQKPNVKLEYFITLATHGITYKLPIDNPVVIRFQSSVPKIIYYPYTLALFLVLILSCYSGFLSAYNLNSIRKYVNLTFYFMSGSIVLGLIVHILAFRHLFLQISPNNDLTYYKYLLVFLVWLGMYYLNKKKEHRFLILAASILTIILYCLPQHLVFTLLNQ